MQTQDFEAVEVWRVLTTYRISCDTKEEGEKEITEGSPTRKEFEVVERKVERVISAIVVDLEM